MASGSPVRRYSANEVQGGKEQRLIVPWYCFCRTTIVILLLYLIVRFKPAPLDHALSTNAHPMQFNSSATSWSSHHRNRFPAAGIMTSLRKFTTPTPPDVVARLLNDEIVTLRRCVEDLQTQIALLERTSCWRRGGGVAREARLRIVRLSNAAMGLRAVKGEVQNFRMRDDGEGGVSSEGEESC